ncbi:MAG: phosphoenolpyruvate--protein phosphotransferase [Eubacterium sp.]|nr:phosphoenolpyruvate--protein phosphotransferase [Eubacterium sp.]
MFSGVNASRGIGIGSICLIKDPDLEFDSCPVQDVEVEKTRFSEAVDKFKENTARSMEEVRKNMGSKEAAILEGHLSMIGDPAMVGEITKMIEMGQRAESALTAVCDMFIGMFSQIEDEMMRQRASDISDVKMSVLKILMGVEEVDIAAVPPGTVLVAHDLTPSMTAQIVKDNVVGIITEVGGKTSHSAILARSLEIPAVLSVENITEIVNDKDTAIVDGTEGEVYINPDGDVISRYVLKREEFVRSEAELRSFLNKDTVTADGTRVDLFCNIGTARDAVRVTEHDGEGVGLFRSEFLFMDKASLPDEEEQFEAYKHAAEVLDGKTVIIRTLDIGGDKDIPYLGLEKEDNPFLGYRAVRYCLGNSEIYKSQLRAILRAGAFGNVKIMIPLVTCVEEVRSVKALVEECKNELASEGKEFDANMDVGCMIETAAASLIADLMAKEADFFSIGTNDLTQYTMSVDRGNEKVSYLYSTYQPAVLRSIKNIIEEGKRAGIPVGMCGESAADPLLIPLLISFGLDEYSVNPALVLSTRCTISKWSKEKADELASRVMGMATEEEVVAALKEAAGSIS